VTVWPTRASLTLWVLAAVFFGGLLVAARASESPLDDPDPARQRPGFLDLGDLPIAAPRVTTRVPRPGRAAVIFFERPNGVEALCASLAGDSLVDTADIAVVISGPGGTCPADVGVVRDRDRRLARAYGLREPRDHGPPVGYAVVDAHRRVRYRTLDPTDAQELREVETILAVTP